MSKIFNLEFDTENEKIHIIETVETEINDPELINSSLAILQKMSSLPIEYDWQLLDNLLSQVHCQEDNMAIIAKNIKTWLRSPVKERPLVFFLAGTSGTGKTFTAKQVKEALSKNGYTYLRLDMNQYNSQHKSETFLGAPPSYVDSGQDAPIFEERRKSDKIIILFDEIEKAHPTIFKIMMNLLDEGILANGHGHNFDFRNSIIFFTSNLAMDLLVSKKQELQKQNLAIDSQKFQDIVKQIIKDHNIPNEISGRIKYLLVYNTLDAKSVAKIALQEIRKLGNKKYKLQINNVCPSLLNKIAEDCKNNNEGARPIERNVENDFETIFQDYQGDKSQVLDIDENKNLVQSSNRTIFSIDEIVNRIEFE